MSFQTYSCESAFCREKDRIYVKFSINADSSSIRQATYVTIRYCCTFASIYYRTFRLNEANFVHCTYFTLSQITSSSILMSFYVRELSFCTRTTSQRFKVSFYVSSDNRIVSFSYRLCTDLSRTSHNLCILLRTISSQLTYSFTNQIVAYFPLAIFTTINSDTITNLSFRSRSTCIHNSSSTQHIQLDQIFHT